MSRECEGRRIEGERRSSRFQLAAIGIGMGESRGGKRGSRVPGPGWFLPQGALPCLVVVGFSSSSFQKRAWVCLHSPPCPSSAVNGSVPFHDDCLRIVVLPLRQVAPAPPLLWVFHRNFHYGASNLGWHYLHLVLEL